MPHEIINVIVHFGNGLHNDLKISSPVHVRATEPAASQVPLDQGSGLPHMLVSITSDMN